MLFSLYENAEIIYFALVGNRSGSGGSCKLHYRAGNRAPSIAIHSCGPGTAARVDQFPTNETTGPRQQRPRGQCPGPESWQTHRSRSLL